MVQYPLLDGELTVSKKAWVVLTAAMVVSKGTSLREVLQHVLDGMADDTYRDAGVREEDSGATAFDKVLRLLSHVD